MTDSSPDGAPEGDLQTVLNRISEGLFAVDRDWQITYANERAREILEAAMPNAGSGATVEGEPLWEAVPGAVDTVFEERYREAMDTQEPVSFEARYDPLEAWFDVRAFPSDSGLSIHFRDITDRKRLQRERRESLRALQRLYAVSSDRSRSFEEKLDEILSIGCEYLDLPNGFLTQIDGNTQFIEAAVATHPDLQPGESCPLDEAYCRRTVEMDELLTVVNAADDGWAGDPAYERFELGTYIGGRVEIDGDLYGTLCFADTETQKDRFNDTQRTFVELLTRWVGYELERDRDGQRLRRERDRLERFASVVSHDLRNPLNTASLRLEMLSEEVDSEHLDAIERSLTRMESLIEDLLALAQDGDVVEDPQPTSLSELIREAWLTAGAPDATLRNRADGQTVLCDPSRTQQLFENLFGNAVEHGSTGTDAAAVTVTVGVMEDPPGIYVADDGPGIPESEYEDVFRTGYTTINSGTGFGLAIVREIAAAHGWEVTVTENDAGGACFEITGVGFVGD